MKETAAPGYKLSKARHSTKILISFGLSGLALGLLTAVLMTITKTGLLPSAVKSYYLGQEIDPGSALGAIVHEQPRPFDELLEITHLHLMGGSLLLFLLCHLLAICELTERLRTFLYVSSFVSFLTTFGLPWLIIYCSPLFAYGFGASVLTFLLSLLILTYLPLYEMWLKK